MHRYGNNVVRHVTALLLFSQCIQCFGETGGAACDSLTFSGLVMGPIEPLSPSKFSPFIIL